MLGKIRSLNPVSAWKFAHMQIPAFQIFLHQKNVVAFVNLKPAVPGHVLVSPRRHVPRLADLTVEENCDLWVGIAQVQAFIQEKYQRRCSVAIQDGSEAGQTVPHVHAHIFPEYEKGEIDIQESEKREPRPFNSMYDEAESYRKYFEGNSSS